MSDLGENPTLRDAITISRDLLESLVDPDDCWFDHHGGCQAHMYLSLEPGEVCPQQQIKDLLARELVVPSPQPATDAMKMLALAVESEPYYDPLVDVVDAAVRHCFGGRIDSETRSSFGWDELEADEQRQILSRMVEVRTEEWFDVLAAVLHRVEWAASSSLTPNETEQP